MSQLFVLMLAGAMSWGPGATASNGAGLGPSKLEHASGELRVGGAMPSFAGWTLSGEVWSYERERRQHPARALVVSFFATWCQPCVRSLPALEALRTGTPRDKLSIVLVAFGEDADVVAPFVVGHGLGKPVLLDPYTKIAQRFGVGRSLPRTFVITPEGRVSAIFTHEGDDFEAALRAELDRVLGPSGVQ